MGALLILLIAGAGVFLLAQSKSGVTDSKASALAGAPKSDVEQAVKNALATETSPAQLQGFADSLLPDYAALATQLESRAKALQS